jgi:hypothetical protein
MWRTYWRKKLQGQEGTLKKTVKSRKRVLIGL